MARQRKILITLPDSLLAEVDDFLNDEGTNRSEFVREAMKCYIKEKRRIAIKEKMKSGYLAMGEINLKLAEMCFEADSKLLNAYEEKLAECD